MRSRRPSFARSVRLAMAVAAALASLAGCAGSGPETDEARSAPRPTRGYILISLDTLGAKHLGAYGSRRPTSPFFDSLAARGMLFENAFVQYPSTLVSHMSIFTGLYPQQHGVYPPSYRLSPEIGTLPERFSQAGFRTAGHTEGGFVGHGYGFARGFDEFTDPRVKHTTDIEKTFEKGLAFLRGLGAEDRFFLFLHTYSIHDPYEPPEPYASLFWPGEPPSSMTGLPIGGVNAGLVDVDDREIDYFQALYDGGVRYADDVLAGSSTSCASSMLEEQTTIVVTSDHGEEFRQHGRVGHTQLYPETLHVPLLVLHPDLPDGRRVPELVQSIDLAPTLLEMAGVEPLVGAAGRSLVPLMERPAAAELAGLCRGPRVLSARSRWSTGATRRCCRSSKRSTAVRAAVPGSPSEPRSTGRNRCWSCRWPAFTGRALWRSPSTASR